MTSEDTKRATLKDVARKAGVATGTVSMVLNDSPLVADATRARVQSAMRELNYVYHRAAGHLRNKRSKMVGVSICNLVNPYYVDVLAGIEQSLDSLGLVSFLGNCAESVDKQKRFFETLREYNVEGMVVTPAIGTPRAQLDAALGWGVPIVQVTRYVPGVETDYVGNDNCLASKMAVDHLAALGHTSIAYIGHNAMTTTGRDLLKGYRRGLRAAGVEQKDEWVVECDVSRHAGFQVVQDLFSRDLRPTALVCFNDVIAFGAMLGLAKLGLQPAKDCSIVGIHDVPESALTIPPLTTVSVDCGLMGREASRLLKARLENPDEPFEHIVLTPKLVVRGTCGAPPSMKKAAGPRRRLSIVS